MYFRWRRQNWIGPDWITDRITEKKFKKNQIVYDLVINKKREN